MFLEVDKRLLEIVMDRKELLAFAFKLLYQNLPFSLAPFFLFFLVPSLTLDDRC